jgi:DNA polymerase III gamma/tau subunit
MPTIEQIEGVFNKICLSENMVLCDDTKEYIINISNNCIRVLINNLEKLHILNMRSKLDIIDVVTCKEICSNISYQQFEFYIEALKRKNLIEAIDILYKIHDYGYSVIDILDYLFAFIKTTPLLDEDAKYKMIPYLCKYITVFHNIHEDGIELALFTNNLITCLD